MFFLGLVSIEFSMHSTYTDAGISQRFHRFIFHPPLIRKLDGIYTIHLRGFRYCDVYQSQTVISIDSVSVACILISVTFYTYIILEKKSSRVIHRRALARHRTRSLLTVWRHLSSCSFSLLNGLKNIYTYLHTVCA